MLLLIAVKNTVVIKKRKCKNFNKKCVNPSLIKSPIHILTSCRFKMKTVITRRTDIIRKVNPRPLCPVAYNAAEAKTNTTSLSVVRRGKGKIGSDAFGERKTPHIVAITSGAIIANMILMAVPV